MGGSVKLPPFFALYIIGFVLAKLQSFAKTQIIPAEDLIVNVAYFFSPSHGVHKVKLKN